MVFTEFLDMVRDVWDEDMVDDILDDSELASGGAYTSVGTYDYRELVNLVVALSEHSGMPVPDLVRTYGRHLFGRFKMAYPTFFQDVGSAFDFLAGIENHIHVEVKKLYPDAELPTFDSEVSGDEMTLVYRSIRPFADFAEGLIEGAIAHWGGGIDLRREPPSNDGSVSFHLRMAA